MEANDEHDEAAAEDDERMVAAVAQSRSWRDC
jgi:hypothetical protein